ncbi:MAG: HAMP domain-containing histidine kinase [Lachnospiraceae bacterium]|nr:HAMP domain-containing histidine kinase [Lachnospiraceae bacterium]
MRTRKGLTRGKSILYYSLQQFSIWLAGTAVACLVMYSFISIKVDNANIPTGRINYDWSLFGEEAAFDETEAFDYMLWNALRDIIRYNVAKSQLETDGAFDGGKVIDIKAFVNRRYGEKPEEIVVTENGKYQPEAAQYYLRDLLKWNKYGLSYEVWDMAEMDFVFYFGSSLYNTVDGYLNLEQESILHDYLGDSATLLLYGRDTDADTTQFTIMNEAKVGEDAEVLGETDLSESVVLVHVAGENKVHEALANILLTNNPVADVYVDNEGNIRVVVNMLTERYRTVNNHNLADCVASWSEYVTYCDWVEQAVRDLSYNYNEYLGFEERYSAENTNIAYSFEMSMMGESVRVSNLSSDNWDGLDEYYREQYGRYMIYRPENMIYESNMGSDIFNEQVIFEAFSRYEYAYPETARIWLGVDTSYPLNDFLSRADEAYSMLHPYAYLLLAAGAVGLLLWFVLFLFLSVKTGWRAAGQNRADISGTEEREAVLVLNWFDDIPTEIAAGLGAASAFFLVEFGLWFLWEYFRGDNLDIVCAHRFRTACMAGGFVLLCSLLFCLFWYSLLRRIKAHTIWKNSLVKMLWQKLIKRPAMALKKLLLKLYDNSGVFFRNLFIIGGIMALNLILGFWFCNAWWHRNLSQLISVSFIVCLMDAGILCIWFYHHIKRKKIIEGIVKIREGELGYQVPTEDMHGENKQLAEAVNSIGAGIKEAVETSMKDERLKADLITNVSHDIKTPLTSIINYVDLLKREKIDEEPIKGYIEVLENKSQRLKQLTDDLLEASKISSGNIILVWETIDLTELLKQALGEFSEKFEEKNLTVMESFSGTEVCIEADSRRIWRVIENLFNNVCKYALPGTRVYLDMEVQQQGVTLSIKNISAQPLNIPAEELTERFIRGDVSRSTEGSGLGLSIAKNLTELQNGKFNIYLDGDLFKVSLHFPMKENMPE